MFMFIHWRRQSEWMCTTCGSVSVRERVCAVCTCVWRNQEENSKRIKFENKTKETETENWLSIFWVVNESNNIYSLIHIILYDSMIAYSYRRIEKFVWWHTPHTTYNKHHHHHQRQQKVERQVNIWNSNTRRTCKDTKNGWRKREKIYYHLSTAMNTVTQVSI